jgi:hypothetical protein
MGGKPTVHKRPALSRTLAAHRPALLYSGAAVTWGGAIAAAVQDVDTDAMLLFAAGALASAVIAFQHAMLTRHQAVSEALTRAVVNRPHDRDHEVTGPFAAVSELRERRERGASL